MPEPNPYEPPRVNERPPIRRIVRQTIGVTTAIVLTPIAVFIVGLISCQSSIAVADTMMVRDYDAGDIVLIVLAIFLPPPIITLIGMIWWVRRKHGARRRK